MSYAPAKLLELRAYMKPITGLADNDLGIVGDLSGNHNGGYHDGWDRRRIVNGALADYSWLESARDNSHKTDAGSAFDLGMFGALRDFSVWAANQCAIGAPDTWDIREIIYSPDGLVVKRFDRLGKRTSGDSSHTKHSHFSFFRDSEDRSKLPLFQRYFEGVDLSMWTRKGDSGDNVLAMQIDLVDLGVHIGPLNADGTPKLAPASTPYLYADGQYGDWCTRAVKETCGTDGTVYGPWQRATVQRMLRAKVSLPAQFSITGTVSGSVSGSVSGTAKPV